MSEVVLGKRGMGRTADQLLGNLRHVVSGGPWEQRGGEDR